MKNTNVMSPPGCQLEIDFASAGYMLPVAKPVHRQKKRENHCKEIIRLLSTLKTSVTHQFPKTLAYIPPSVTKPLPFHEARTLYNRAGSLSGHFIHFYIDDSHYECLRAQSKRYLPMLRTADFVIGPDFSTYRDLPYPVMLKNTFDNFLLSAYFQSQGVRVVQNVVWCRPMFYDITFEGYEPGGAVSISSKAVSLRDRKGLKLWLHGYRETIRRLRPEMVIRIGKIIPGEESIYPNPVRREETNPYIERLRNGR